MGAQIRSLQEPTLAPVNSAFSCDSFPIPHRPTKLLLEPAACKSLKILKVASRALASLLITERGICGNRAEIAPPPKRRSRRHCGFHWGNRQKKSQLIRVGTLSIGGGKRNRTCVRFPKRIAIEPASVRVFGPLSFFPRERYQLKSDADWVGERGSSRRVAPNSIRISQSNRRPQIQATSVTGN